MKSAVVIGILTALVSLAVFGALVTSLHVGSGAGQCLSEILLGTSCPLDPWAGLNFHFDALKVFTNAVFDAASLPGFLAIALGLILLLIVKFVWDARQSSAVISTPQYKIRQRINYALAVLPTLRWILRLNNSPSSAY